MSCFGDAWFWMGTGGTILSLVTSLYLSTSSSPPGWGPLTATWATVPWSLAWYSLAYQVLNRSTSPYLSRTAPHLRLTLSALLDALTLSWILGSFLPTLALLTSAWTTAAVSLGTSIVWTTLLLLLDLDCSTLFLTAFFLLVLDVLRFGSLVAISSWG